MTGKVILRHGKDESVKRFHPWIFSGAVKQIAGKVEDGCWVEVFSSDGTYLASGHYQQKGSITVRILSWEQESPDIGFWTRKINQALERREKMGLLRHPELNAWRLVFAEGDFLPGLIIDFYDYHLVVQCHSMGMQKQAPLIAEALQSVLGPSLKTIYHKSEPSMISGTSAHGDSFLFGDSDSAVMNENGSHFRVNWVMGQKTGFFLDQRENRALLKSISEGKRVLNTFCYTGGFSLAALSGGATLVHSADSSKPALDLLQENIALNRMEEMNHHVFASDTLQYLKGCKETYDIIILDPPAYAKHLSARHNAIQGYRRLNAAAMQILPPGGLLMTFSCSQVVDRKMFEGAVMAAALDVRRKVTILQRLVQPADHPVSLYHPEGEYLKGLLLMVE